MSDLVLQHLFGQIEVDQSGCWNWQGIKLHGYGYVTLDGRLQRAHRVSYSLFVGPLDSAQVIDHTCRNKSCVNPDHLEQVSQRENVRRAASLKTHCPKGHEYSTENTRLHSTGGYRVCRACMRNQRIARERRVRENRS